MEETCLTNITIDGRYDDDYLIEHGKEIRIIEIPSTARRYNINYRLLSYCPNVEEFIVHENEDFVFENNVLYTLRNNQKVGIHYAVKNVECMYIGQLIDFISYCHGVKKAIVDDNNSTFRVEDNLLINTKESEIIFAFSEAEQIVIPEGIVKIHSDAFAYCHQIQKIEFPSTYRWDDHWCFSNEIVCPDIVIKSDNVEIINAIIIQKGFITKPVVYLGDLSCCTLPNSITKTWDFDKVFSEVQSFIVQDDHPTFTCINGIILDKTKTKLIYYPKGRKEFDIPPMVETICKYAISGYKYLSSVSIPKHVRTVEEYAFANCPGIKHVSFEDESTVYTQGSFFGCPIAPMDGVYYIGKTACGLDWRYNDSSLKIKEGTKALTSQNGPHRPGMVELGTSQVNIDTLILPESIKEIGFLSIPIKDIIVDSNNSCFFTRDGILFSRDMKELIRYPENHPGIEYNIPAGVESIAAGAFFNCQTLKKIVLPDSIKMIGKNAFAWTKLELLELSAFRITIEEGAITPFSYSRLSGLKNQQAITALRFRHKDIFIPVILEGNWGQNSEEKNLQCFIAAPTHKEALLCYNKVKSTGYKRFMAMMLWLKYKDTTSKQYLIRVKKLIDNSLFEQLFKE